MMHAYMVHFLYHLQTKSQRMSEAMELIHLPMGFLGYHHIKITKEDRHKTTFATEWGFYQYVVMPFRLKNSPTIFYQVVVASFSKFIHKFLEVYFDDWTIYGLLKNHIENLRLMLERCRQYQISLNLKKCIFCATFGILLGHLVYKQ